MKNHSRTGFNSQDRCTGGIDEDDCHLPPQPHKKITNAPIFLENGFKPIIKMAPLWFNSPLNRLLDFGIQKAYNNI